MDGRTKVGTIVKVVTAEVRNGIGRLIGVLRHINTR